MRPKIRLAIARLDMQGRRRHIMQSRLTYIISSASSIIAFRNDSDDEKRKPLTPMKQTENEKSKAMLIIQVCF